MMARDALLCVLIMAAAAGVKAANQTLPSQNLCIFKHMVKAHTGSEDLTLANVAMLFDSVTINYHEKAPAHASLVDMTVSNQFSSLTILGSVSVYLQGLVDSKVT